MDKEFDLIIIGSGPIGTAIAHHLLDEGFSILMIGAGKMPRGNRWDLMERAMQGESVWAKPAWVYESEGADIDLNEWAIKDVGGGTNAWGATTPRFLPSDFRLQEEHGIAVDWPFRYDDLEPHYTEAEYFMGVAGQDDNPWAGNRSKPYPMPAFDLTDSDLLVKEACGKLGVDVHSIPSARNSEPYDGRSKCINYGVCRACPIDAMWTAASAIKGLLKHPNFQLLEEHHVKQVTLEDGGRRKKVHFYDPKKELQSAVAPKVVFGAHAIENARLLLMSDQLANPHDQVGRNLSDHPKFFVEGRVAQRLTSPHRMGYETATSFHYHNHAERGTHAGMRLLVRENAGPSPAEFAATSGYWGAELKREVRDTFGHFVLLGALMEMLPNSDNRVTLSSARKNAFGDPAARTHFKLLGDYEQRGVDASKADLFDIFKALDASEVLICMQPSLAGHYNGVHRMGTSPENSVTDGNMELHGNDDVFVCGTGSFSTPSTCNPTLTAMALAFKLAHHIGAKGR